MLKIETINLKLWKEQGFLIGEAMITDSAGVITKQHLNAVTSVILVAVLQADIAKQGETNDTH